MKLRRVDNPPNPFVSEHREWLGEAPPARVEVYEESSGSILSRNDSPDLPFDWSANPYRGCQHACIYCYARTYHEYLGLGAGTDFETKLVVKRNAPELLRQAFRAKKWKGEFVNFSGVTDCYQPIEACYRVTRGCLEVCVEHRNPAMVVTKGVLVMRDADVLARLNECAGARVIMSIPFADAETSKLIEPQAPAPAQRFAAMRRLHEAGVPVGIFIAPVIPGLNDKDIPQILEKAAACGARSASCIPLRLEGCVQDIFVERIKSAMPLRAKKIMNRLHDVRGGRIDESRFGHRFRGTGAYWESIRGLFEISKKRYGLDRPAGLPPVPPSNLPQEEAHDAAQLAFEFET